MAAPTLLDYAESTYTGTGTTETTDNLAWNSTGDRIVVLGATEVNSTTIATPTGTGLTLAALTGTPTNTASSCKAYGWEDTIAGGAGNTALSATVSANQGAGISAWAFSNVLSVQNPVVLVNTAAVVSMTVVADSSVVMILADFDATADVTVTTSPVGGTIREATNNSGRFTVLVIEWHNQAAGTRNYGVTAWTGTGTISKVAAEVRGAAGGSTVNGTATGSFGFSAPAAGKRTTSGSATGAFGYTAPASGTRKTAGSATGAFGFSGPASGRPVRDGTATGAFGFTALAAGRRTVHGAATGEFGFNAPAAGDGVHQTVEGSATGAFGFTAPASGRRIPYGQATGAFGFTAAATGQVRRTATASLAVGFAATASGRRVVHGSATALFGFTAPAIVDEAIGAGPRVTASTPVGRIAASTTAGRTTTSTPPRYTTSTGGGRL